MKKRIITVIGVLSVILVVGGCATTPVVVEVEPEPVEVESFSVRYYPNSATGGTVPEDVRNYESGEVVEVQGNNEGTLVNTGFSFNGWNTEPDGRGYTYDARGIYGQATFIMGMKNTKLYAVWADPVVGPWNLTSVNGRSLALAQEGFQAMTLVTTARDHSWTITSTPLSGEPITSTGTWATTESNGTYTFTAGNIVIFNAKVKGSTLTLTPTSLGTTEVMVFSK